MFERTDNVFGMTQTLGAIGQTLENLNDNTGCEQHFLRAIELARSIDHDIEASRWSIYLASLYLSTDRVEEARLLIASLANKEFVDPQLICMYDQISGDLHLNDGDLDAAWTVFDHARAFAASINSPHMAVDAHGSLRDVARRRGDLETYIEHSEEYHRLTEELHGRDAAVRLTVLEKQREIDDLERRNQRHLEILYSTLPREIADRVARGEEVSGDRYDQTVVFFIDIVGFTAHSADLPDAALVRMLSKIYGAFDAICARHSITKIKTIGDSYMAFSADKPLVNVIKCACEMMAVQFEWPSSDDATVPVRFRMGMHIGPVTAGVIGTERLQYDIWGDTVNVASRMESTGEPGRIHVSEAFAAALRSVDSGRWTVDNTNDSMTHDSVTLQQRGEITVKGKGPMTTYWLMQS
jgi:class 3 adenylate cyclase